MVDLDRVTSFNVISQEKNAESYERYKRVVGLLADTVERSKNSLEFVCGGKEMLLFGEEADDVYQLLINPPNKRSEQNAEWEKQL